MDFVGLKNEITNATGYNWWVFVGMIVLVLVSLYIYLALIRRKNPTASTKFLPHLIQRSSHVLFLFFLAITAQIALSARDWNSPKMEAGCNHALNVIFIALGGWVVLSFIAVMRQRILRGHDITAADNYQARKMHTQFSLLFRLLNFLAILIIVALILTTFSSVTNLGKSLLASAGVAGVIIGFAAQKTIGSVFAGMQIAITQPIRIEDAVVVEGEWGWVEEITLTYVVIRIWDKRRMIVPITYFTEKPFQNWTRQDAEIIGSVIIHTDYSVPVDAMRLELDRLLDQTPLWNRNVKVLQVVDTTPREVQLRALMTGKDSPTTWDLRCFVREGLIAWLQANYPQALPHTRLSLDNQELYPQKNNEK